MASKKRSSKKPTKTPPAVPTGSYVSRRIEELSKRHDWDAEHVEAVVKGEKTKRG